MNRISKLFNEKENNILSIYFTAGFPNLSDTASIIKQIEKSGADIVEIGMPFSDPVADGPVIQQSNDIALKNGMNIKLLFEQLSEIKNTSSIPKVLMGYINPVLQYGIEEFCKSCKENSVDGVILPDLPVDEYENNYKALFDQYDLLNILLVCPETQTERLNYLCNTSQGFIYAVSTSSTTGFKSRNEDKSEYFNRVKFASNGKPVLIGFGIHDKSTFLNACTSANGAIIGSAFIKELQKDGDLYSNINQYIQSVIN